MYVSRSDVTVLPIKYTGCVGALSKKQQTVSICALRT